MRIVKSSELQEIFEHILGQHNGVQSFSWTHPEKFTYTEKCFKQNLWSELPAFGLCPSTQHFRNWIHFRLQVRSMNGAERNAYRILVGKPEGKRTLGRPIHRWWKILKWILGRQDGMVWTGSIWLRIGTSRGLL
jgi:hypothetical protein